MLSTWGKKRARSGNNTLAGEWLQVSGSADTIYEQICNKKGVRFALLSDLRVIRRVQWDNIHWKKVKGSGSAFGAVSVWPADPNFI